MTQPAAHTLQLDASSAFDFLDAELQGSFGHCNPMQKVVPFLRTMYTVCEAVNMLYGSRV